MGPTQLPLPPETATPGTSTLLRVDVERRREEACVRALGEVDLSTARELEQALAALPTSGLRRLIIDLRGLTFMDCAGARVLARKREACRDAGVGVELRVAGGIVERVVTFSGLDDLVPGS